MLLPASDLHNFDAVADLNPNSTFLGIDLSPIQPGEVPPNCHFMVDDIEHENGWDLEENHFDFIHLRHTLHSVRDRSELMQRAYRYVFESKFFVFIHSRAVLDHLWHTQKKKKLIIR